MVSAGVLIAGGGAAVAAGVDPWSLLPTDSPTALFVFNPAVPNTPPPGFTGTTYPAVPNPPTPVIASSVSDIGTVNIAGVGPFQYWVARTQNGRWCQAFRAPNGTWAGTTHGSDPTYSFGGEVPGCVPGVPEGSPLASLQEGFDPQTDSITPAGAAFDASTFILFGTYDNPGGQATTVVDTIDGMSTPLLDGHYFEFAGPYNTIYPYRLEAVDSSGNVISRSLEMPITREERQSFVRQARLTRARARQRADAAR